MPNRVLIVDDNQDLAENIAEILSLRGYATEIATSAEEALPKAIPDGPGILVTDYRLPGMSGADLVREIRQVRRGLRAVVISAYTDDGTISAARQRRRRLPSQACRLRVALRLARGRLNPRPPCG